MTDNDSAEPSPAGSATNRGRAPLAIRSNEEHQGERQPKRTVNGTGERGSKLESLVAGTSLKSQRYPRLSSECTEYLDTLGYFGSLMFLGLLYGRSMVVSCTTVFVKRFLRYL